MPKGDYQRLKADIEDGIVPIAHILLEALSMAKLNGVAKGIVLFVWRRTYGWSDGTKAKHKDDRITLAEFALAVNSERTYVSKQLKLLVQSGILVETPDPENGRYKRYGMNTEINTWSSEVIDLDALLHNVESKLYVHSSKVVQRDNRCVDEQGCANEQQLFNQTTQPLRDHTTFTPKKPSDGAENGGSKNSLEKYIADDAIDPPLPPNEMTIAEFEDEVQFRMRLRTGKHTYRLVDKDYKALHALLDDSVDRQFILDGIDEAFESYAPKHRLDQIHSFYYCAKRIYDRWQIDQAKRETAAGGMKIGLSINSRGSQRACGGGVKKPRPITGGKVGRV